MARATYVWLVRTEIRLRTDQKIEGSQFSRNLQSAAAAQSISLIIHSLEMAPKQDEDDGGWTTIDHPASSNNQEEVGGESRNNQDQPQPQRPLPSGDGTSSEAASEACDEKHDGVVRDLGDLNLMSNLESRFFEGDKAMYTASADAEESAVKVRIVSVVPPNYKIALPSGDIIDAVPFDHPGLLSLEEYESHQLQQEVGMLDIVSSELYGGSGGGPFNDLVDSSAEIRRITEIELRSGSIIDGVGATYSDGKTTYYGGEGGGLHRLVLKKGEYITEVTVRYGKLVTELTFVTNTGRSLSRGGQGSLILGGLNSSIATVKAPGRFYALCALSGRFGRYLDAIQFHWGPVVAGSDVQRQDNKDIVTNLASRQHLKTTELYGNEENGTRFDDGHFNIQCTGVSIVSLCDGPVRGLTARYYTGREVIHGGKMSKIPNKTECISLNLSKGEYISKAKVTYSGDAVVGLAFTTNKNRTLGPCGVASGEEVKESIVEAPQKYRLIGFHGTSGEKKIHSIGFNWSPVPKGH